MLNKHLIQYKNPIILKDEEGKTKQTTYDLPKQGHTYGKKINDDPQPMKYVVNGWNSAKQADNIASKQKNFKELNKIATKTGVYTAKGQKKVRNQHDIMIQQKKGQKLMPIFLPEEGYTYGIQNRPSTPVKLVIGNCYAIQAEEKNSVLYKQSSEKHPKKKNAATTKSQWLREQKSLEQKKYRAKPNINKQFKMQKFINSNVTKVDTRLLSKAFQGKQTTQNNQKIQQQQNINTNQ